MNWKVRLADSSAIPIYRQIENAIRAAIESGELKHGDRLPSVIDLARKLGINKLTVVKAFQKLEKTGLVRSEVGRGTFVSIPSGGDGENPRLLPAGDPKPELAARSIRRLREGYARGLRELIMVERRPGTINLSGGVPNPDTVDEGLLERLSNEVLARDPRRLYEYAGPAGLPELRETLSDRLIARGTFAAPDEIMVTNGSQQALSLGALFAREEGRAAVCETPVYAAVPQLFMLYGDGVHSVARDPNTSALDLDHLSSLSRSQQIVLYVCPDFQNPSGGTMSASHRHQLAEFARSNDVLVIVDEIFRDLRFMGEEPPSLYAMLPPGRRILVSSISKSFMTGLRCGFLVADRSIIGEMLVIKRYLDLGSPSLTQAISAAFLRQGYQAHLEKVRESYRLRRDAALAALEREMPRETAWTRPEGGFQLWVAMPSAISSIQLFLAAIEQGVSIVPGPVHDVDGRFLNCFRLGYGYCPPEEIGIGIARLARIIEGLAAHGSRNGYPGGLGVIV